MNGINSMLKLGVPDHLRYFKNSILSEKKENSLFFVYNSLVVKPLTCLRLKFSHLNEHKFRHGFKDTINAMSACGTEVETTEQLLL